MSSSSNVIQLKLPPLTWKVGFEIELMAPAGQSRKSLADAAASHLGGAVFCFFHQQSEPSKVPGMPVFHNLTQGFRLKSNGGEWLADFVDDLTLQAGLQRSAPPQLGWYRILSDDERLLRLITEQADPNSDVRRVLDPIANLFGTDSQPGPNGMVRVNDRMGASVAMAAPLPGERERPTELVTAPLVSRHLEVLEEHLGLARKLGFTIPEEGATHIHFDAAEFRTAKSFKNLIRCLARFGEPLKKVLKVNPNCRRLGSWPEELLSLVSRPGFENLQWPEVQRVLKPLKLTKFCDFNVYNLLSDHPTKKTVEIRVLPAYLTAEPILRSARLLQSILRWCLHNEVKNADPLDDSPESQRELLQTAANS